MLFPLPLSLCLCLSLIFTRLSLSIQVWNRNPLHGVLRLGLYALELQLSTSACVSRHLASGLRVCRVLRKLTARGHPWEPGSGQSAIGPSGSVRIEAGEDSSDENEEFEGEVRHCE